jgi:hypothetical protein
MVGADLSLSEAIESLRAELTRAQALGQDAETRFAVGPVAVELLVQLDRTAGGEASVKVFNLLNLGGSGEVASSAVHKVTLELTPIGPDGERYEVSSGAQSRPDGAKRPPDGP